MKICVYAISKNEEHFVKRFFESAKDADLIILGDTGSTDNTVSVAQECGIEVYNISVQPWRFDDARNATLALVPADVDVCVSLDIDEILMPGWREEIERVWTNSTTRLQYRYDWSQNHIFNATKVHKRVGYTWKHICHEMVFPDPRIKEVWATTDFLLIKHLPDDSKSRSDYLPLLEADAKEKPYSARSAYYYARELWFRKMCPESIKEFRRYLALPDATWYHERSAAQRYIARCYDFLGDLDSAYKEAELAHNEAKTLREPLCLMAEIAQKQAKWPESFRAATMALDITKREYAYTSEEDVWESKPYDLAALAAHYLGMKDLAVEYGTKAVELNSADPRLVKNLKYYTGELTV